MATNIRRKVRRLKSTGDLPCENDLEFILHGYCMLDGVEPTDTAENLWRRFGKTIMQLQNAKCGDLVPWHAHKKTFFDNFERPAIWWTCGPGKDEPRRLIAGDTPGSEKDYLLRHPELLTDSERLLSKKYD